MNGGPQLKETQSYTPEFGKAVASSILDTDEEDGKVALDVLSSFLTSKIWVWLLNGKIFVWSLCGILCASLINLSRGVLQGRD